METKQEYKILAQEAWASTLLLYVTFEVNGVTYQARSTYLNGAWAEDIEVWNEDTGDFNVSNDIYELGAELIEDLEIEKHLTC